MKTLRAIGVGALLWVLIFFEVSILMFGFKLQTGLLYYVIHYILIALFTIICASVYFRKVKPNLREGVLLGLIMLVTGIILDALITILLFVKDWAFFASLPLILGYLEGFVVVVLTALAKKK